MFRNLLPSLHGRRSENRNLPETRGRDDEFFSLMDEFFNAPLLGGAGFGARGLFPAVDVTQEDDAVVVSAELPGIEPKDVELSLEHGNLVIKGEKRYERKKGDDIRGWSERGYGAFHRMIPLPEGVQEKGAKADYKNGVLSVRLPLDADKQPRRIAIQG